jgi:hypothetical protein
MLYHVRWKNTIYTNIKQIQNKVLGPENSAEHVQLKAYRLQQIDYRGSVNG